MSSGFACDYENARADNGAEAEPDQVPPCEATLHVVLALFRELEEFERVGGAVEKTVFEARGGVGERVFVGTQVVEGGFWEEVLLGPSSPVASGFWALLRLVLGIHGRWCGGLEFGVFRER